jgi:hypothetical protein
MLGVQLFKHALVTGRSLLVLSRQRRTVPDGELPAGIIRTIRLAAVDNRNMMNRDVAGL